jgi:hypothetical protein
MKLSIIFDLLQEEPRPPSTRINCVARVPISASLRYPQMADGSNLCGLANQAVVAPQHLREARADQV